MAWRRFRDLSKTLQAAVEPELPVHALSLRFLSREAESGFVASKKSVLIRRSRALCTVALFVGLALLIFGVGITGLHKREVALSDAEHKANIVVLAGAPFFIVGQAATIVVLSCTRFVDAVRPVAIEVIMILGMAITMVALVLGTPANICALQGLDVRTVMRYSSDSTVLLSIDGVVTAMALVFPARWIIMLPVQIVSVLLYGTVICIGGSEPVPWSNLCLLTGLVVMSSIGKRYAELNERKSFLSLIEEKSLRCDAEFRLSLAESGVDSEDNMRPQDDRASSHHSSSAATDRSGSVFNLSGGGPNVNVADKLARVRAIAKAERWSLEGSEVKLLRNQVLGRGGYGIVVKGLMSGIVVAVKVANKSLEEASVDTLEDLCQELRVFRHLRHPNIVSFHGAIIDALSLKLALVLECVQGVVLHDFVRHGRRAGKPDGLPSSLERFQVLLGLCSALLHMHTRAPQIVHSDLKGTNAMVELFDGQAHPKLLDFGFARVLARGTVLGGGTWAWMAPELMRGDSTVKCSVDVYSFGHLINFIVTGMLPLRPSKAQRRSGRPPSPLSRPLGYPLEPACGPLADACLRPNEAARPSIVEVHQCLLRVPEQVDLAGAPPRLYDDLQLLAQWSPKEQRQFDSVDEADQGLHAHRADGIVQVQGGHGLNLQPPIAGGSRLPPLPEVESPHQSPPESSARRSEPAVPPEPPLPWRILPGQKATPPPLIMAALLDAATHWNIERKARACCNLHAAAEVVIAMAKMMEARDCTPLPVGTMFCTACNLIWESNECEFCMGMNVPVGVEDRPNEAPMDCSKASL